MYTSALPLCLKITPCAPKVPVRGAEGRTQAHPHEPGCEEDGPSSAARLP